MKQRPRIYYSASQRALIWDRWQNGETLHQIAGLFDRYYSSLHRIVAESGGILPTQRQRSRSALTSTEREEISRGVVAGGSIRSIAAALGRAPSTIRREIRRNGGREGYRASCADQAAWTHAESVAIESRVTVKNSGAAAARAGSTTLARTYSSNKERSDTSGLDAHALHSPPIRHSIKWMARAAVFQPAASARASVSSLGAG